MMTSIVMREDLLITNGISAAKTVSPRSTNYSCSECATPIFVTSTACPSTILLRPGTLDDSALATPQAHIWVRRKQDWLILPDGVPQFEEGYERHETWPESSLARLMAKH